MGVRIAAGLKAKEEAGKAVLKVTPAPEFMAIDAKDREGTIDGLQKFWVIRCADAKIALKPMVELAK